MLSVLLTCTRHLYAKLTYLVRLNAGRVTKFHVSTTSAAVIFRRRLETVQTRTRIVSTSQSRCTFGASGISLANRIWTCAGGLAFWIRLPTNTIVMMRWTSTGQLIVLISSSFRQSHKCLIGQILGQKGEKWRSCTIYLENSAEVAAAAPTSFSSFCEPH